MTFPKELRLIEVCFPKGRTYSPPPRRGSGVLPYGSSALLRRAKNNDRYVQEGGDSA